jgi:ATP-dependent RNA helicase MSS116
MVGVTFEQLSRNIDSFQKVIGPYKMLKWTKRQSLCGSLFKRSQSIIKTCEYASLSTSSHLSDMTFESLTISTALKKSIKNDMQFKYLTHVQKETIPIALQGKDLLGKGKTGHGKTLAFLVPTIEKLIKNQQKTTRNSSPYIGALVLAPTRELAAQILDEAKQLTKYKNLCIIYLAGGISMDKDLRTLAINPHVDLLVATPGRLHSHLEKNTKNITKSISNMTTLVLDEADRLLDMGFRKEILSILGYLPSKRQTLLFSATLPSSTDELTRLALHPNHAVIDTVEEEDHDTNVQAVQESVTCKFADVIPTLEQILIDHTAVTGKSKIIVFFPTARQVSFMSKVFQVAGYQIIEIHSRMSQSKRTKASETFRKQTKAVMFSSDVSARGIDYPDVSLVIQVGLTTREQYIHRLGRTARAGASGKGILLLADYEKRFLKELQDLPLHEHKVGYNKITSKVLQVLQSVSNDESLLEGATLAYQAWLGFYNTHRKALRIDVNDLVRIGKEYSENLGLKQAPALDKKILKKMNLANVPGIRTKQN